MKKLALIFALLLMASGAFAQKYVKFMSYNVRSAKGMDNVRDCRRVARVILDQQPDVVAVQELDSMTRRSGKMYILGEIAQFTGMHPEYFPAIEFDGGKYGIGILSKEKPIAVQGYPLPGREEKRALLVAEFQDYMFACTHLSLTEADRLESLEIIGKIAAASRKPFYLAGDLNDEPGSQFLNGLQENFRILNDVKAHTFPAPAPDRTLDYIAVWKATAPKLDVAGKHVIDEPVASDHRPVEVLLRTAIPAEELFRTKPYLQNPADGGMTVMWETIIPAYSWVEYGTDTSSLQRVRLLVDGQAEFNESIHKIRLENLKPGQKYFYRVCSQEILYYGGYHKIFGNTAVSPFYSFVTPMEDAQSFTALVFNDLHQRKYVFDPLFEQVKDVDYDFVIFNGDCIDDPKDHDQATGFIQVLTEAVNGSSIPTLFIRGNHEIRNAYSIGLRKHVDYIGGRTYSAFNWGDTRFVVLDCGEDKKDDHREYSGLNDFTSLRLEQVDFLKQELVSSEFKNAGKRILLHHIPIYGMLGGNLCEPLWRPMLDNAPFNLALNGHTHQFAYHPAGSDQNNYPVIIGGGKGPETATVMVLEKKKDVLKVKVINTEGKVLLEWSDKEKQESKTYVTNIDGIERSYIMHLPENLKPGAPLVFVLHGYGAQASQVLDKGFNEVADKYGFAVCYPQGSRDHRGNPSWNVGYPFQKDMNVDDVSFLCQLAAKLQKEYGLSKKNTFCTGMSNGGEMCYLLAYSNQKTFAAVAPIAGLTMAWMPQNFTRTGKIPLFEIHGTEDRVSEWCGDMEDKGGWGAYIPVPDVVQYWVKRNGCIKEIVDELPLKGDGAHKVIAHKYVGKKGTPPVWLYEVVGGVHSWFNEDMDTAEEIWKFFVPLVR